MYRSTPFGFEEKLSSYLDDGASSDEEKKEAEDSEKEIIIKKKSLHNAIKDALERFLSDGKRDVVQLRREILEVIRNYYSLFLGKTNRPVNDIDLYAHSIATGGHLKALLIKGLLEKRFQKEHKFHDQKNWLKILHFSWDGKSYLNKSFKAGDFVGRDLKLSEFRKAIREIIEEDIPLGNTIYEDPDGCFAVLPGIDHQNAEYKEIFEAIASGVYFTPGSTVCIPDDMEITIDTSVEAYGTLRLKTSGGGSGS